MKSIAVFNNKGGVGKTTLTYHVAFALAELGHRTLLVDLDPQSNLTLFGIAPEDLHNVWRTEDPFIDDFANARKKTENQHFNDILGDVRSIHFLLKPTEDGTAELSELSNPVKLHDNLGLVPARLTLHMYEDKIASRWSDVYLGDPLAIRTITQIRALCSNYGENHGYEIVLIDTSPSLGILNKVIISTADGFIVPCMPDMFSLYGIQNIGKSLRKWKQEFDTIFKLISEEKRGHFPTEFVRFLGFTIYNAKKYSGQDSKLGLARAHYNYAQQIPNTIREYIGTDIRKHLSDALLEKPIGGTATMHSHSTLPNMAQKYRAPIWNVPSRTYLEPDDKSTISGNRNSYEATKEGYHNFARELLERLETLE